MPNGKITNRIIKIRYFWSKSGLFNHLKSLKELMCLSISFWLENVIRKKLIFQGKLCVLLSDSAKYPRLKRGAYSVQKNNIAERLTLTGERWSSD